MRKIPPFSFLASSSAAPKNIGRRAAGLHQAIISGVRTFVDKTLGHDLRAETLGELS